MCLQSLAGDDRVVHDGGLEAVLTVLQALILLLQLSRHLTALFGFATALPLGRVVKTVEHHVEIIVGKVGVDRPNRRMASITAIGLEIEALTPRILHMAQDMLG